MKRSKRLFALLLLITLVGLSFSCAQNKIIAPAATPETTFTVAPTAAPTPTPSLEPTPTLSPIEQKETEVNQEIRDFLNGVGEYQDYKMDLGALIPQDNTTVEVVDLGIISCYLDIQGCLIDFIEKDDYFFLVFGFESKDKARFVTTLGIPEYFYEGTGHSFRFYQSPDAFGMNSLLEDKDYSHDIMVEYLNKLKGQVCGFPPYYKKVTEQYFRDHGWQYDWVPRYVEEVNSSTIFAKKLLNTVATNDIEHWSSPIDPEFIGIWRESKSSEPIVGINEIDYKALSGLDVPLIRFEIHCKRIR